MDMNITKYRFDLVFSYWIFAWFLLYFFGITQYSPKLALCVSLVENAILLGIMIFVLNSQLETIIKFLIINTFIKAIPLYSVWTDKINWKLDLVRLLVLFLVYIVWMLINSSSRLEEQNEILKNTTSPYKKAILYFMTPVTPGMLLYDDLKKYFGKIEYNGSL